jgi:hypothetical protein
MVKMIRAYLWPAPEHTPAPPAICSVT